MNKLLWLILAALLAGCTLAGAGFEKGGSATPGPVTVSSADDVRRISVNDTVALLDEGAAVLYDTRSVKYYRQRHAAGAVSLPADDVGARFDELPADKALIFYCT